MNQPAAFQPLMALASVRKMGGAPNHSRVTERLRLGI